MALVLGSGITPYIRRYAVTFGTTPYFVDVNLRARQAEGTGTITVWNRTGTTRGSLVGSQRYGYSILPNAAIAREFQSAFRLRLGDTTSVLTNLGSEDLAREYPNAAYNGQSFILRVDKTNHNYAAILPNGSLYDSGRYGLTPFPEDDAEALSLMEATFNLASGQAPV